MFDRSCDWLHLVFSAGLLLGSLAERAGDVAIECGSVDWPDNGGVMVNAVWAVVDGLLLVFLRREDVGVKCLAAESSGLTTPFPAFPIADNLPRRVSATGSLPSHHSCGGHL